jgi:hypothetical protein
LAPLHAAQIVHGDLKPSNILVAGNVDIDVRLIDFGMFKQGKHGGFDEVIATYRYLPPRVRAALAPGPDLEDVRDLGQTRVATLKHNVTIGPEIDAYALGVITLEMLTGRQLTEIPEREAEVRKLLHERATALAATTVAKREAAVSLICAMLAIGGQNPPTAGAIAAEAKGLADGGMPSPATAVRPQEVPSDALISELLRANAELLERTQIFVRGRDVAPSTMPKAEDEQLVKGIETVFADARSRIRTSWRLGIGMTVAIFLIILVMITVAIVLSIVTGKAAWGLVFGGAGVSTIIGTLIWRPYDRLFGATILAQQIEMIHLEVITGLGAAQGAAQKAKICRDAGDALRVIFKDQRGTESKRATRKKTG